VLTPGGDWLFPGCRADRPKSQDALRAQIGDTLAERCGLDFTPHAFRHLAAYKILEHDPTAYPLVQRVLGHKSLETTVRFYCGLEVPQALAHFRALVLASSQRGTAAPPRRLRGR
jgi:integrase